MRVLFLSLYWLPFFSSLLFILSFFSFSFSVSSISFSLYYSPSLLSFLLFTLFSFTLLLPFCFVILCIIVALKNRLAAHASNLWCSVCDYVASNDVAYNKHLIDVGHLSCEDKAQDTQHASSARMEPVSKVLELFQCAFYSLMLYSHTHFFLAFFLSLSICLFVNLFMSVHLALLRTYLARFSMLLLQIQVGRLQMATWLLSARMQSLGIGTHLSLRRYLNTKATGTGVQRNLWK